MSDEHLAEKQKLGSQPPKILVSDDSKQPATPETSDEKTDFPKLGENYSVLDVIGQGGMGTVYQVEDLKLKTTLAVKVLKPELATDQAALKRFEQESRALSELNHPNIVAVFASGKTESGAPYLVMDYIQGNNLAQAIKNMGGMDAARALSIFIEICDALHYAHDKGIIHRDLKPSNIILSDNKSARVVDFGIAKVISKPGGETVTGLTQMGDLFGTPTYMSPEQCEGEKLDARSDIYSLGCVMFETLNGTPPFTETNPFKLMTKHCNERAPSLAKPGVSKAFADVIAKCLEKRPERRYQSTDELMNDLVAVRDGKAIAKPKSWSISDKKDVFKPTGKQTAVLIAAFACVIFAPIYLLVPALTNTVGITTGQWAIASKQAIRVFPKPMLAKPQIEQPEKFRELKSTLEFSGPPLSNAERSNLRKLLYEVTPTRLGSFEPILTMGTRTIPALLEEVRSSDIGLSRGAAAVLTRFGSPALPVLAKLFKVDSNRFIADALEQMGDPGIEALAPNLNDPDPQVRARAAESINDATRAKTMTSHIGNTILWLALNDEDATVREECVRAAVKAPVISDAEKVIAYIALNDSSASVRAVATKSLVMVADREGDVSKETLDNLGWIVQSDSSETARLAVFSGAYMRNYGEHLAPYLKYAYYNGSTNMRREIIQLSRHEKIGEVLLPELVDALRDHNLDSYAMYNIAALGPRAKGAIPALQALRMKLPLETNWRFGRGVNDYQLQRIDDTIKRISM